MVALCPADKPVTVNFLLLPVVLEIETLPAVLVGVDQV